MGIASALDCFFFLEWCFCCGDRLCRGGAAVMRVWVSYPGDLHEHGFRFVFQLSEKDRQHNHAMASTSTSFFRQWLFID